MLSCRLDCEYACSGVVDRGTRRLAFFWPKKLGCWEQSMSIGRPSEGGVFISLSAMSGRRLSRQGEDSETDFRIRYCCG